MRILYRIYINCKTIKFNPKGSMNAQKGSKGIALFFLEPRRLIGWAVKATGLLAAGANPASIAQETRWVPGPIWMGAENLAPHRDSKSERSRP
jgi:hypothetical protein